MIEFNKLIYTLPDFTAESKYKYNFKEDELWFTLSALTKLLNETRQSIQYHCEQMDVWPQREEVVRQEGGRLVRRRMQVIDLASAFRVSGTFLTFRATSIAKRMNDLIFEEKYTDGKKPDRRRIVIDF